MVNDIIKEVNKIPVDKQRAELEKNAPELLIEKPKEKKEDLRDLPDAVEGKFVTRMAPEPSKYNHIGHALSFLLNYMYSKKYKGKCVLRFEDTNPEKVTQEYVDAMNQDVIEYLDIKPDKIVYISDDMEMLYKYAEELIEKEKAYVCFCEQEKMQDLRHKGKECECREKDNKQNTKEWKDMLKGKYKEGECALRIKGDMESQNHVMRDSVIFRIVSKLHYRKKNKYKVWPMYDFYNPIEDASLGVTHILRSNEFMLRGELQNYIKDLLNLKKQTIIEYGRFNVIGAVTQGREIRALIESGQYMGWDDPRLVTLRALKRRGILKETYYELAKEVGLSPSPTNIDFKMIATINRRFLDKQSNRYFFIQNPRKIKIKNAPELNAEIDLHPDFKDRGKRELKTKDEFYIEDEIEKGKAYRFMHLFNFKDSSFVSEELDEKLRAKMIHWLPVSDELIKTEVLMPDATTIKGVAEPGIKNLKVGEIIQFERFGFCRLDQIEGKVYKFWFTHK
jgi:glutamyl-tRNA synthetase